MKSKSDATREATTAPDSEQVLQADEARQAVHAWRQLGVASSLSNVAGVDPRELNAALATAARRGIIPTIGARKATALVKEAQAAAIQQTLKLPVKAGGPSIADLLTLSSARGAQQAQIVQRILAFDGPPAAFWDALSREKGLGPVATRLRATIEIGALVEFHGPLLEALLALKRKGGLASPRELVRRDAAWWLKILGRLGTAVELPKGLPGSTRPQRLRAFAERIADNVARAFPTAALAERLVREKDPDVLRVVGAARDGLNSILEKHPDLDLRATPIAHLLSRVPGLLTGSAAAQAQQGRDLARLQRVFRLAGGYEGLRALAQEGFDSAHAVRRAGRRQFLERLEPHVGRFEADLVYRRAARAADMALNLWATFSPAVHQTRMQVLNDDVANVGTLFGTTNGCSCQHCGSVYGPAAYYVDVLTFLAHRRGRHVLSSRPRPRRTALEILLGWRPDLADLELTCENTNTLVPTVDLVLEVLEREVARLSVSGALGTGLDALQITLALRLGLRRKGVEISPDATVEVIEPGLRWAIRQPGLRVALSRLRLLSGGAVVGGPIAVRVVPQSVGEAEELSAYPRFVSAAAYAKVADAPRPWCLPFDLRLAEARASLQHLGVPRLELMEALAPAPELVWRDPLVALEPLGLSRRQAQLLTGSAPEDAWQLWGVQQATNSIPDPAAPSVTVQGDGLAVLAHVSVFLQRAGLSFGELLRLLETRLVNPPTAAGARPLGLTSNERCDPSEARLQGLNEAALHRAHRFVRLWRAVGWSTIELDLALHVLRSAPSAAPAIDEPLLIRLSQVRRLQARLRLPVETLLGFWGPLATRVYRDPLADGNPELPSLFDRIFRARPTSEAASDPFALDPARDELADTTRKLTDVPGEIGAALRLSADELARFLAEPDPAGPGGVFLPDVLSLGSLSQLQRSTVLARALGLSAAEYLAARVLIGDPFAVPPGSPADFYPPEATLRFVAAVDFVRDAGFSIAELDRLLRHRLPAGVVRTPEQDAVDRLLVELLGEVRPIAGDAARRSHAVAKLSERLALDAAVVRRLVETVLPSTSDPATHLLDDVLVAAEGGLSADYFPNRTLSAPAARRQVDRSLAFDWTAAPPPVPLPGFSARWAGSVQVEATGTYRFEIAVRGTARLSVGGQPVLEKSSAAASATVTADMDLEAGILHDVELTFVSPASRPALRLAVTGPGSVAFVPEDARLGLARLDQVARLSKRLAFSADEIHELCRRGAAPGWLAFAELPVRPTPAAVGLFPRWRRLVELSRVKAALPAGALFDLMAAAGSPATSEAAFLEKLAERARWSSADLDSLRHPSGWSFGLAGFQDERLFVRLQAAFSALLRLGLSAAEAWGFTRAEDDPGFAEPAAARQVLRARGGEGTWLAALAAVRDGLREAQQRALVACLVDERGLPDAAALSAQLLVDVEMSACQKTTRLKQAISSVQTFVQRCQLHLEAEANADPDFDPAWRQWEWMKNYRVWEASRKVFLYPENWIEPELRDDKSPFFRELESDLLQGDLTDELAEAAIERYLEKLHEVARLDIRAVCRQPGDDPDDPQVLHLIGRSAAPPHVYYHRQRASDGSWTAWKKVDVDIEGDHLMAVVVHRRLTLLWPVVVDQNATSAEEPQDESQPELAKKSWKVQMAWSEYRRDAWSPKKVSQAGLTIPLYLELTPASAPAVPAAGPIPGFPPGIVIGPPPPPATRATFIAQDEDRSSLYFQVKDDNTVVVECYSRPARQLPGKPAEAPPDHEKRIDAALAAGENAFDEFLGIAAQIPFLGDLLGANYDFRSVTERPSESWADDLGDFAKDAALAAFDLGIGVYAVAAGTIVLPGVIQIVGVGAAAALVWADVDMTRRKLSSVLRDLAEAYEDEAQIGESAFRNALNKELQEDADRDDPLGNGLGLYLIRDATGIPELARKALRIAVAIVKAVAPMSPPRRLDPEQSQSHFLWGKFKLDCADQMSVVPKQKPSAVDGDLVPNADTAFNSFHEEQHNDTLQLYTARDSRETLLRATPGEFRLARPGELRKHTASEPFVYQDGARTFLATPRLASGLLSLSPLDLARGVSLRDVAMRFDPAAVLRQLGTTLAGPSSTLATLVGGLRPSIGTKPGTLRPGFFSSPVWSFETFEHPFVCRLRETLARNGVKGLLRRTEQQVTRTFFRESYRPAWSETQDAPYPVHRVDFAFDGSYSLYNWELFFHIPLLVATQLGKNQRFAEAQKWFHFIFDPTASGASGSSPSLYWKTLPLFETSREDYAADQAERLLARLAAGAPDPRLEAQVEDWRAHPFSPHRIARLRTTAYQKAVVMRYIDNLVQWGDQLFRRETLESLNEAAGLYALAAQILGPRPPNVPPSATPPVQTWSGLERALAPQLEELESYVPLPSVGATASLDDDAPQLSFVDPGVFCVPQNDKLLGCWDTVADRLFKIRHCLNIEGTLRQLPPFEPPIDPALLVRAAAAGVDIASVLDDLSGGAPPYRFGFMHQKALELCAEVRGLGANLLAALEKRDGEALAALRATQESGLLQAVRRVREQQVAEARAGREALELSRRVVQARFEYYDTVEFLNPMEAEHLDLLGQTLALQTVQGGVDFFGNLIALVPNTKVGAPPTLGVTFGGDNLAQAVRAFSSYLGSMISILGTTGSLTATMGGYARRADEWKLQRDLAAKELKQLDKQLVAAQIREAISGLELANHDRQLADVRQVESFLTTKYTNEELFGWMSGQLSSLHFQAYRLAYDVSKRAEAAFKLELGASDTSFIQFGYWDTLKKGLLAGERLALDLRRMEAAYLERNVRDPELTRHVSLALLNPRELLRLKELGTCVIDVPEALFDLDHPGHYLRRIKSLSVTVPCVTGPYAGVPCKLTLLRSQVRTKPDAAPGYRPVAGDARILQVPPPAQSLFLSSAQSDSGLFETNLRDERFLPFEGHGAVGTWQLELPGDFRPFDYDTIADVILHVRYTAKDGGNALKTACVGELRAALNAVAQGAGATGFARLFVLRQEVPDRFHAFLHPLAGASRHELTIPVTAERFPFLVRNRTVRPAKLEVFLKVSAPSAAARAAVKVALDVSGTASPSALAVSDDMGLLRAEKPAAALGDWTLSVWREASGTRGPLPSEVVIEDAFLICYYEIA